MIEVATTIFFRARELYSHRLQLSDIPGAMLIGAFWDMQSKNVTLPVFAPTSDGVCFSQIFFWLGKLDTQTMSSEVYNISKQKIGSGGLIPSDSTIPYKCYENVKNSTSLPLRSAVLCMQL